MVCMPATVNTMYRLTVNNLVWLSVLYLCKQQNQQILWVPKPGNFTSKKTDKETSGNEVGKYGLHVNSVTILVVV